MADSNADANFCEVQKSGFFDGPKSGLFVLQNVKQAKEKGIAQSLGE